MAIIKERLLFAIHADHFNREFESRLVGLLMRDTCLPIACSHEWRTSSDEATMVCEYGFHALWETTAEVALFFEGFGQTWSIDCLGDNPGGLWVYEVTYDEDRDVTNDDEGGWHWLCGGTFRRPTFEELEPMTSGRAPWGGITL